MHVIVICIIRDNYVLGPAWAVHIEFNKKKLYKSLKSQINLDYRFSKMKRISEILLTLFASSIT